MSFGDVHTKLILKLMAEFGTTVLFGWVGTLVEECIGWASSKGEKTRSDWMDCLFLLKGNHNITVAGMPLGS